MKKVVLLFTCLLFSSLNLFSNEKPIILSDRVGEVIDEYEATYFGFFKWTNESKEIRFSRFSKDSVKLIVKFHEIDVLKDTSFSVHNDVFNGLKFYVENFENMFKIGSHPSLKNPEIWKIIVRRVRYFPNDITWGDFNDEGHRWQLLYVDSVYFAVWLSDSTYNYKELDSNLKIIFYNQIYDIEGEITLGSREYYWDLIPQIKSKLSFVNYYNDQVYFPKELIGFIEEKKERFMGAPVVDSSRFLDVYERVLDMDYTNYFILGYSKNEINFKSHNETMLITESNIYVTEKNEIFLINYPKASESYFAELCLYFSPIYFYGSYSNYPTTKIDNSSDFYLDLNTKSVGLKFRYEYILMSTTSWLSYFNNKKVGLYACAGVVQNEINIKNEIRNKKYNTDYKGYPYSIFNTASETGYEFGFGIDYTIFRGLFIGAKMNYYFSPSKSTIEFFRPLEWKSFFGREYSQKTVSEINLKNYSFSLTISYGIDTFLYY